MIAVTALNFIKLEYVDEFKKLADELVAETRKENGAIFYSVFRDRENKAQFCFIEKWESYDHLKAHFKSEHFKRIVPQIEKFKLKKDIVNIYEEF